MAGLSKTGRLGRVFINWACVRVTVAKDDNRILVVLRGNSWGKHVYRLLPGMAGTEGWVGRWWGYARLRADLPPSPPWQGGGASRIWIATVAG